ncbi:MAG: Bug family tripartite tricarboxylate transporter substrate binding protein [Burkholderiales bacterium]
MNKNSKAAYRVSSSIGVVGIFFSTLLTAQTYPVKPVRLIIPNAPGGIDLYARVMTPRLGEELGQPVIVENRPGAGGIIGAEAVAKSPADGYTLLFGTSGILVTVQFLNKNMPLNIQKDLTPISQVLGIVSTLTVNAQSPINSVADLVTHAKRNPGKLSFGSSGVGTLPHLNGEIFKVTTGVDMLHVPLKGTAQMMTEMLAGRTDIDFSGLGAVRPLATSGKLRILAVQGGTRFAPIGDIPSINETYPNYRDAPSWIGLMGPAGMTRPLVDRIHGAVAKSMGSSDVRAAYEKQGLRIIASSAEELANAIKTGSEQMGALIKAVGIQPE